MALVNFILVPDQVLMGQKKAVNSFASEEQVLPVCDHCFFCGQLQEYNEGKL